MLVEAADPTSGPPRLDIAHEHERIDGAIDATPRGRTESEVALAGLQASVRAQIIAISKGEITSKTMSQLQRFCASVGQALVTLERPDALVRQRFSKSYPMLNGAVMSYGSDEDLDSESLAPAPANETYGANASRGLIESAAKIGKDMLVAQAEAQRAPRRPSMTEMITALRLAKVSKMPKKVIKAMEKQLQDAAEEALVPTAAVTLAGPPALPAQRRKNAR